jgi:hypothetical protein
VWVNGDSADTTDASARCYWYVVIQCRRKAGIHIPRSNVKELAYDINQNNFETVAVKYTGRACALIFNASGRKPS